MFLFFTDMLGKTEESKSHLCIEIESLKKELLKKDSNKDSMYNEIKSKVQHWKVRSLKLISYSYMLLRMKFVALHHF